MNQGARSKIMSIALPATLAVTFAAFPLCAPAVPLHPGDKVTISVYNHPELLTQGQLDESGSVTLPLAGTVKISGMEPAAADRAIADALRRYVRYPAVDVTVTQPNVPHVAVAGQVASPGNIALISGNSLIAAIYGAGGPLQNADFSHVSLLHNGLQKTYDVAAVEKGNASQNPPVTDGDVIFVPKGHRMDVSTIFSGIGVLRYFVVP
jgi:polysaccharide export outer membrane protein